MPCCADVTEWRTLHHRTPYKDGKDPQDTLSSRTTSLVLSGEHDALRPMETMLTSGWVRVEIITLAAPVQVCRCIAAA